MNWSDPSGLVIVGGNYPPGGAADIILALQRIQNALIANPTCDCYFKSHGGRTLSDLLADPNIFIFYYPRHIYPNGPGTNPALGANFPVSHDVYITPDGLSGVGASDLAGTIVHELLHRNNGGGGSEADAEGALEKCGILPSFSISITKTVKAK